ncbi:unnamed protein product [Euphydryas editha]|uniref:Tc1-like transposase DDE domain-containing protein n=1 Tax=Euphydryas editha TaxID=104508 RepID=A0AAU9TY66_EUPED|nr:unnamed protein product [Euphydryas editha]
MGYKWQKCHNKRRILVERPAVIYARSVYLREIRRIELTDTSSSNRLILVHAGSRAGFLNSGNLLFKASTATGDYHRQMNQTNFEKWTTEMLIPNLPPPSVVVMDNATYHSVQENKVPTKCSTKPVMLEWLLKNNVEASILMRKDELFRLIEIHKPKEKTFKIDEYVKSHGHIVVRLPSYMCDLNPIELAWAKIKRIVRGHHINSDLSLIKLREVTELAISQVTEEDWRGFDDHVIVLEEHYWQRDGLIEDAVDRFLSLRSAMTVMIVTPILPYL